MIASVQEQVLGYLLGALDDAEMEQVHARLQSDEEYQRQWAILRQSLASSMPRKASSCRLRG